MQLSLCAEHFHTHFCQPGHSIFKICLKLFVINVFTGVKIRENNLSGHFNKCDYFIMENVKTKLNFTIFCLVKTKNVWSWPVTGPYFRRRYVTQPMEWLCRRSSINAIWGRELNWLLTICIRSEGGSGGSRRNPVGK